MLVVETQRRRAQTLKYRDELTTARFRRRTHKQHKHLEDVWFLGIILLVTLFYFILVSKSLNMKIKIEL
jgi:Trk-type K+ transport system membrane component